MVVVFASTGGWLESHSRQTAPSLIAQLLHGKNTFYWFACSELPARKQFDSRRRARGRQFVRILNRALYVGHVLKRFPEHFFLLNAVRTPIKPIHLRLLRGQTLRKSIVAMIPILPPPTHASANRITIPPQISVFRDSGRASGPPPRSCRRFRRSSDIIPFPHNLFLISRAQAATSSAPGNTSNSSQSSVNTSPSTMTSTAASKSNSTRLTAFLSAIGCSICVPS